MHYLLIEQRENLHPFLKKLRKFASKIPFIVVGGMFAMLMFVLSSNMILYGSLLPPDTYVSGSGYTHPVVEVVVLPWLLGSFSILVSYVIIYCFTSTFKIVKN